MPASPTGLDVNRIMPTVDLLAQPTSSFEKQPPPAERAAYQVKQRDIAIEVTGCYNPDAVVCVGVPFGHTRWQWIPPYGGEITVDGSNGRSGPPTADPGKDLK